MQELIMTIGLQALLTVACAVAVNVLLYLKWIIPKIVKDVPPCVPPLVIPYIDGIIETIEGKMQDSVNALAEAVGQQVEDVKSTVRTTSARFEKSVQDAERYINGFGVDLEDPESVAEVRKQATARYGSEAVLRALELLTQALDKKRAAETAPTNNPDVIKW